MGGSKDPVTNSPANLLLLCSSGTTGCHGWVESHRELAYATGLLVHSWQDPRKVPLTGPYLNDEGAYTPAGGAVTIRTVWQPPRPRSCTHGGINAVGGPSYPTDNVLWCDECRRFLVHRTSDYWAAWEPAGPLMRLWLRLRRRI